MNKVQLIVDRLLEDDPPITPEQPKQSSSDKEEDEDIRDLFLRLNKAPEPFQARSSRGTGLQRYQQMSAQLTRRPRLKIDNNTYLLRGDNGAIHVRLHQTNIVTYSPDGTATFNTGGWPTRTTRDRIDAWIPAGWAIYTEPFKKHGEETPELWWETPRGGQPIRGGIGKMFWYNRATNAGTYDSGWYIPFTDGDSIAPDGTLHHQAEPKERKRSHRLAAHGWP